MTTVDVIARCGVSARDRAGPRRRRGRWGRAWPCTPRPRRSPGCAGGSQARLATALVVREDSLTLFGFADTEERELFTLLQTVGGVGPRLALATLAVLDPDALRRALADGDATALTRVPGIGRKGAERMVLELRDKVVAPAAGPECPRHGGRPARPGRRGAARPRLPDQARGAGGGRRARGRRRQRTRRRPCAPR